MEVTPENIIAVLKEQIAKTQQTLNDLGYDPNSVREQVADLAKHYGGPALDVGTGACACLAVMMAQNGLSVTAVDHASSAVRIARERAVEEWNANLEVHHADAAQLPFPDNTYRTVTAFDALCHADDPVPVVKEMFRVCGNGGVVMITELNDVGRQITHHHDDGFQKQLPDLLSPHCRNCRYLESDHHVTFICEKN